jgi:hypothetical protein
MFSRPPSASGPRISYDKVTIVGHVISLRTLLLFPLFRSSFYILDWNYMDHPLFNSSARDFRRGDLSASTSQLEHNDVRHLHENRLQSEEQNVSFASKYSKASKRSKLTPWPWYPILAQLVTIACLVASGIVLATSNHKPQSSWSVRPSVVLGILAPIGAFCLSYVHKEAGVISWWLRLSDDVSLTDLEREWAVGQSYWDAVFNLSIKSSSSLLAISTLSLSVYIAVNPLLQRACTVEHGVTTQSVKVNTSIPINIPLDWSTTSNQTLANHAGTMSSQLLDIVQDYMKGTPARASVDSCDGICVGNVHAFGLNGTCHETSSTAHDWAKEYFEKGVHDPATVFNVSFPDISLMTDNGFLNPESIPQFQFLITFWTPQNATYNPPPNSSVSLGRYQYCPGVITTKNCTYFVDQVQYPVSIKNSTISLNSEDSYFGPPHKSATHLAKLPTYPEKLSGLQIAARSLFSSSTLLSNPEAVWSGAENASSTLKWAKWDVHAEGTLAAEHVQLNFSDSGSCFQTYTDPTDEITHGLSDILLRSAIAAAKTQNEARGWTPLYQQTFQTIQTKEELVFASHYGFFAIAAALTLLEAILVSLPFWGWWRLRRPVSLSPLETAVALKQRMNDTEDTGLKGEQQAILLEKQVPRNNLAVHDLRDSEEGHRIAI